MNSLINQQPINLMSHRRWKIKSTINNTRLFVLENMDENILSSMECTVSLDDGIKYFAHNLGCSFMNDLDKKAVRDVEEIMDIEQTIREIANGSLSKSHYLRHPI